MNIPELKHQNFSMLSNALLDYLDREGEVVTYAKDDLVLDYGLEANFMPIVLSGTARVMRVDNEDASKELLLYFLSPGEICPCAAFSCLPHGIMPINVGGACVYSGEKGGRGGGRKRSPSCSLQGCRRGYRAWCSR